MENNLKSRKKKDILIDFTSVFISNYNSRSITSDSRFYIYKGDRKNKS